MLNDRLEEANFLHRQGLPRREIFPGVHFREWAAVQVLEGLISNADEIRALSERAHIKNTPVVSEAAQLAVAYVDALVVELIK